MHKKVEELIMMAKAGTIQDCLRVKVCAADKLGVRETVHRQIGDIALVLCAVTEDGKDSISGFMVPSYLADAWGLPDNAIDNALANSASKDPAVGMVLSDDPECLFSSVDIDKVPWEKIGFYGAALSTRTSAHGATALFYPGVADLIADRIEGDFYAMILSTHQVLIHSTNGNLWAMKKALLDTVEEVKGPEHVTRSVYRYSRKTRQYTIAL